ncbi:2-hydroxychromene-2-carboxylate isomerase [Streptomyces sp. NBC_00059]|uniref:2-hydroxychromene-2-carboxylate isomerase n=1 Tax=Streptomyces sp. NBC_00059 TaxID=2975635 RepID=UPI002257A57C|nr:DsbA family protein [Streptomyces sp. NBC_00059]MCX5415796.1 DsbA family protein [Streptomyces sp. NBC_00059]
MTQAQARRSPRHYFSFRSPYSWLAHRELTEHHPALGRSVERIPFWEPDRLSQKLLAEAGGGFTYQPMSREKHFYILQDVRRLTRARGLDVSWPVDRDPHWEVPHLAWFVADRQGASDAFTDAVFSARWLEGRDICDPFVIADIARRTGVDPEEAAGAADSEACRAAGLEALLRISRDGVFGVPFFLAGGEKFWGLDRLAPFVAALGDAPSDAAAGTRTPLEPGERADPGHAGGCG